MFKEKIQFLGKIMLLAYYLKNGGRRGIRTLGTPFQAYGGLANRWFKPAHPSFHVYNV